mmetsp:Transcript_10608/g.15826  ORF Transcript_10608/g.15826 Transcript_10608/m.15826 type:complete len:142 (+) Transcript_10608:526-951(+)
MESHSEPQVIRIEGKGMWAPGGLHSIYDSSFPPEMENWLSEDTFNMAMRRINNAILFRWPCMPCYTFSTVCCPFTLGLSTLFVRALCFSEAEEAAAQTISEINNSVECKEAGIEFRLVYRLCESWIEVSKYEDGHMLTGNV